MSQENVEIVRHINEACDREGSRGQSNFNPEVEYVSPAGAVEPGTRQVALRSEGG